MVGDSDGVVVLPLGIAEELAQDALEIATYDEFAEQRIAAGRSIIDIFPPSDKVTQEYNEWKKTRD